MNIKILERYIKILQTMQNNSQLHRLFFQILINAIYKKTVRQRDVHSKASIDAKLNLSKLRLLNGGISFIIDQYLYSHSTLVKENCFVIIFDYVMAIMEEKNNVRISKHNLFWL